MKRVYERPLVCLEKFTPNRAIADSCGETEHSGMRCLAGQDTDTISVIADQCTNKGVYHESATVAKYGNNTYPTTGTAENGIFCICIADASNNTITPIGYDEGAPKWTLTGTTLTHANSSSHSNLKITDANYDSSDRERWHCQVALSSGTPTLAS